MTGDEIGRHIAFFKFADAARIVVAHIPDDVLDLHQIVFIISGIHVDPIVERRSMRENVAGIADPKILFNDCLVQKIIDDLLTRLLILFQVSLIGPRTAVDAIEPGLPIASLEIRQHHVFVIA